MRIMWNNLADPLTLTPLTEDANYVVENIQDRRLSKVYRSTADAAQTIVFDAGVGNTIAPTTIVIAAHNITDGATIEIQGNATDSWGAPSVDVTLTHDDGEIIDYTLGGVGYRYWRLAIDDGSNPDTYIELGRVFLGTFLQLEMAQAFSEDWVDGSVVRRSQLGQVYANRYRLQRKYTAPFPVWSDSEKQGVITMIEGVRRDTPLFLVPDESNVDKLAPLYATIDENSVANIFNYLWRGELTFLEAF